MEVERVKVSMLEARLKAIAEDKADLKIDRDRWRAQAEKANLLLTDHVQVSGSFTRSRGICPPRKTAGNQGTRSLKSEMKR